MPVGKTKPLITVAVINNAVALIEYVGDFLFRIFRNNEWCPSYLFRHIFIDVRYLIQDVKWERRVRCELLTLFHAVFVEQNIGLREVVQQNLSKCFLGIFGDFARSVGCGIPKTR